MEVKSFSSDVAAFGKIVVNSVLEAVVAETLLVTQRSVASLLMVVGCLLKDGAPLSELATIAPSSKFVSIAPLSELISPDRRFPFEALSQKNQACTENKDGSDTEDDNDDDDGDAEDQDDDDDANDEDFSGEEGGDDEEEEGDPEEDPAANGNEGSDDEDDDDDDDGDEGADDDDDDDDEEEEEDEEEDEDQPPEVQDHEDDDYRIVYFGESYGHLHLIQVNRQNLALYNIYEMKHDGAGWFLKYEMNVEDVVLAFPHMIRDFLETTEFHYYGMAVLDVVRGDKEDDSFLILHITEMVILRYNLVDKSFYKLWVLTMVFMMHLLGVCILIDQTLTSTLNLPIVGKFTSTLQRYRCLLLQLGGILTACLDGR